MEIGAILSLKPVGFIELPPTRKSVERKMFKIPFGQPNFGHVRNPFPHTYRPICPPTMAIMEQRETPMSFYQLLGIPEDGTLPDIKQAYRQLARKYHPDVCPPDQAEEYTRRFIEVQEAYETLSDPRRKNMYDSHLARRVHPGVSARKCWDYPQEVGYIHSKQTQLPVENIAAYSSVDMYNYPCYRKIGIQRLETIKMLIHQATPNGNKRCHLASLVTESRMNIAVS